MWTIRYKNAFIHGYADRNTCKVQIGQRIIPAKSLHSAKCLVTWANRGR